MIKQAAKEICSEHATLPLPLTPEGLRDWALTLAEAAYRRGLQDAHLAALGMAREGADDDGGLEGYRGMLYVAPRPLVRPATRYPVPSAENRAQRWERLADYLTRAERGCG